jgi:hypothetical protein
VSSWKHTQGPVVVSRIVEVQAKGDDTGQRRRRRMRVSNPALHRFHSGMLQRFSSGTAVF